MDTNNGQRVLFYRGARRLGVDLDGWPEGRRSESVVAHVLMADDQFLTVDGRVERPVGRPDFMVMAAKQTDGHHPMTARYLDQERFEKRDSTIVRCRLRRSPGGRPDRIHRLCRTVPARKRFPDRNSA